MHYTSITRHQEVSPKLSIFSEEFKSYTCLDLTYTDLSAENRMCFI